MTGERLAGDALRSVDAGHDDLVSGARRALAGAEADDALAAEVAAGLVALSLSARAAYLEVLTGPSPALAPSFCSVLWAWENRPAAERERCEAEARRLLLPGEGR